MNLKSTIAALFAVATLASCSKNNNTATPENPGNYIVTVSPVGLNPNRSGLVGC